MRAQRLDQVRTVGLGAGPHKLTESTTHDLLTPWTLQTLPEAHSAVGWKGRVWPPRVLATLPVIRDPSLFEVVVTAFYTLDYWTSMISYFVVLDSACLGLRSCFKVKVSQEVPQQTEVFGDVGFRRSC